MTRRYTVRWNPHGLPLIQRMAIARMAAQAIMFRAANPERWTYFG